MRWRSQEKEEVEEEERRHQGVRMQATHGRRFVSRSNKEPLIINFFINNPVEKLRRGLNRHQERESSNGQQVCANIAKYTNN